jgi:putative ABC transport system ATP-binding protein
MLKNHFIELSDVTKIYQLGNTPVTALDHLHLQILKGEFLAITGKSGCGKSTLINIIGGLDAPDQGQVMVDGEDITRMDDHRLTLFRRKRVGIIFQLFNLLPILSVEENIALPHLLMGNSNPPEAKIDRLLQEMELSERRRHKPHELSGGEMQRVAICRALINDPELILADEPTGNLDSASGKQVLEILKRLKEEQGKTILLVTHSQEGATIADRVLKMQDGRLLME